MFPVKHAIDPITKLKFELLNEGYSGIKSIKSKGICAVHRFSSYEYPFAVYVNLSEKGCDSTYQFKTILEAFESLGNWDGNGHPPGDWYNLKTKKQITDIQTPNEPQAGPDNNGIIKKQRRPKKSSHTDFRNGKLFCFNCGVAAEYEVLLPMDIQQVSILIDNFGKAHKKCKKTWVQPVVDQSLSIEQKATWWLENGEHNKSSKAIFHVLTNSNDVNSRLPAVAYYHPCDLHDFYLCYMLLETIPEWKGLLSRLKPISPEWSKLVDHWPMLTIFMEQELGGEKTILCDYINNLLITQ